MKKFSIFKNSLIIIVFLFSCKESNENPVPITQIPNADFEDWEMLYNLDKPVDWGTSNLSLYGVVTFNTVKKDGIEKFSGNYSSKLETKSQIIDNSEVKVVGLLTLGNFDVNLATRKAKVSGGLPFSGKPAALEGYYKYIAVGKDSCFVDIAITKFNKTLLKQDTIGHGKFSSSSISDWTAFNIPIQYYLNQSPDSLNIVILSSDTSIFEPGSTLWIDNLNLKY